MKMVLYRADGRVEKGHEDYLEREAKKYADSGRYTDQIEIAKSKDPKARDAQVEPVRIIVDEQYYKELYDSEGGFRGQALAAFDVLKESNPIPPKGLDRRVLMRCSSLADDFFTYEPTATALHLPVYYPRQHSYNTSMATFKKFFEKRVIDAGWDLTMRYKPQLDDQMAYIRENEITEYIVPWLKKMERALIRSDPILVEDLPLIQLPDNLLERIHLYNAMLQLGISSHFQRPLIDALVLQMYKTNLNQCHLDTLEMTVCRFYSRGLAILDPVINHLIGTYSLRSAADRQDPKAVSGTQILDDANHDATEDTRDLDEKYWPINRTREWLTYSTVEAGRADYPDDTISFPPRLEVLGHCIRHWSGVRRNGSTTPAHTGFPLNVGRVFKYYRRRATSPIRRGANPVNGPKNFEDYSTYRLNHLKYFHDHAPGSRPEESADGQDSAGGEDSDGGKNPTDDAQPPIRKDS